MNYKRFSEIPGLFLYFLLLSVTTLRTEMPKNPWTKAVMHYPEHYGIISLISQLDKEK